MAGRVAVAAPNPAAAAAGARLGALGGNAVDAALAAALVTCVTEPGIVSLGGGAFVTVDDPALTGSSPVTVDGYVEMPGRGLPGAAFGRGTRELVTEYGGGTAMTIGHGSVATPGVLPAFEEAHRRYGSLPWSEVVSPAIEVARDGFILGRASDYYFGYLREDLFGHDEVTRAALYHDDGRPVRVGERLFIPDLADFLEQVRRDGAAALMTGEVARSLAADMAANGGLVTVADLDAYRPVIRPATRIEVGGAGGAAAGALRWTFHTNPPPSIGGPVLAAMLLLMPDAPRTSVLVEVFRAVLAHRSLELDVSGDRAAAGQALLDGVLASGQAWLGVAPSTAQVSVVGGAGGACSITTSTGYGSGITVAGTGVWLNNCLGEHELNRSGLHSLAPGTRLASNMAPTVGRREDGATLAIGSPGSDRITTALAQVITAIASGAMGLAEAIDAPRLHVSRTVEGAERLEYEQDMILDDGSLDGGALPPESELPRRAHPERSMYFGGVAAAMRGVDGSLFAAADPRRDGATAIA
jgi:gamma-glutamyltranspeptidase/glutathione hydrolase